MTRPYSISRAAQLRIIERDQTTTTKLTQVEQIAVKFECAISMTKQVGFPDIQARGELLVKEYEIQLRGLAEFADDLQSCVREVRTHSFVDAEAFHIEAEQPEPVKEISDYDAWLAAEKQYAYDGSKENRAAVWLAWKKIHPTASPYHF